MNRLMKLTFALIVVLMLSMPAFAASKVGMFGSPNSSGTGPMEVDSDRKIAIASDAALHTDAAIYLDGSIYISTITIGSSSVMKLAGGVTLDPCPTLGKGTIFINATSGVPCFCNSLGVDLSLYNGTTACF